MDVGAKERQSQLRSAPEAVEPCRPVRGRRAQPAEDRGEDADQTKTTMTDVIAIVFWRRAVRGERFGPARIAAMVRRCL